MFISSFLVSIPLQHSLQGLQKDFILFFSPNPCQAAHRTRKLWNRYEIVFCALKRSTFLLHLFLGSFTFLPHMLKLLAALCDNSCDVLLKSLSLFPLFCLSLCYQENFPLPARHPVWLRSRLHLSKHFSLLFSGNFDLKMIWCKILVIWKKMCHCDHWASTVIRRIQHQRRTLSTDWPLLIS